MALLLLCAGFTWSGFGSGKPGPSSDRAPSLIFHSPLLRADLPRLVQGHFGGFSHHSPYFYGLDFVARPRAIARAMRAGKVVALVEDFERGHPRPEYLARANYVLIEHQGGLFTFYAHLKKGTFKVHLGDQVKVGAPLGEVGCSGYCEADHLHIEAFVQTQKERRSIPIKILDSLGRARMIYARGEEVWSLEKEAHRY